MMISRYDFRKSWRFIAIRVTCGVVIRRYIHILSVLGELVCHCGEVEPIAVNPFIRGRRLGLPAGGVEGTGRVTWPGSQACSR